MTTPNLQLEDLKKSIVRKLDTHGIPVTNSASGRLEWKWVNGLLRIRLYTEP